MITVTVDVATVAQTREVILPRYAVAISPVQIGERPLTGYIYSWSPTAGLSDPNIANPIANQLNHHLHCNQDVSQWV
jgi:hypothetical protein